MLSKELDKHIIGFPQPEPGGEGVITYSYYMWERGAQKGGDLSDWRLWDQNPGSPSISAQ